MRPVLRSRYFDLSFFLRFLPILLILHYFHSAFLGVTSPEGRYYFAVLDEYVNYISWLRLSILHASNFLVHIWGIDAFFKWKPDDQRGRRAKHQCLASMPGS